MRMGTRAGASENSIAILLLTIWLMLISAGEGDTRRTIEPAAATYLPVSERRRPPRIAKLIAAAVKGKDNWGVSWIAMRQSGSFAQHFQICLQIRLNITLVLCRSTGLH